MYPKLPLMYGRRGEGAACQVSSASISSKLRFGYQKREATLDWLDFYALLEVRILRCPRGRRHTRRRKCVREIVVFNTAVEKKRKKKNVLLSNGGMYCNCFRSMLE